MCPNKNLMKERKKETINNILLDIKSKEECLVGGYLLFSPLFQEQKDTSITKVDHL
jgi:hypothetical protein